MSCFNSQLCSFLPYFHPSSHFFNFSPSQQPSPLFPSHILLNDDNIFQLYSGGNHSSTEVFQGKGWMAEWGQRRCGCSAENYAAKLPNYLEEILILIEIPLRQWLKGIDFSSESTIVMLCCGLLMTKRDSRFCISISKERRFSLWQTEEKKNAKPSSSIDLIASLRQFAYLASKSKGKAIFTALMEWTAAAQNSNEIMKLRSVCHTEVWHLPYEKKSKRHTARARAEYYGVSRWRSEQEREKLLTA